MMNEFSENSARVRLSTLLGLAATKKQSVETCPSSQHLALFIDGQVNKKMRKQMLAHLNQCEKCRSIWLETTAYLESKPESDETSIGHKIFQGIRDFLSPGRLFIGGITVAILVFVVIPRSNINQRIDSGYQMLSNRNNTEAINVAKTISMPWDNAVWGFSKTNNKPEKKAFGAGLWQGKNRLLSTPQPLPSRLIPPDQEFWQDTDWVNYYQLGRFIILLWVETQLSTKLTDWSEYEKTLTQLRENLAEQPVKKELTQSMLVSLEQVREKFEVLKNQQNIAEKKPLQRLLEVIMQKYSPG